MGPGDPSPYRRRHACRPRPEPPDVLVIPTLRQLAWRAVPQAFEAAIVPAVLFLVAEQLAGARVAIAAPLAWALGVVWWRSATARRVPAMMILAVATLVLRSVLAFAAESTFLYFLQPAVGGLALSIAFLVSVVVDRPLARRFAGDFCRLPARVLAAPAVHRFFRRISVMWGLIGLGNAAVALWLLTNQSTGVFVVAKTVLSTALTAAAVAVSTLWFRRTVARDDALAGAAL